jgi:hypothetical protein
MLQVFTKEERLSTLLVLVSNFVHSLISVLARTSDQNLTIGCLVYNSYLELNYMFAPKSAPKSTANTT